MMTAYEAVYLLRSQTMSNIARRIDTDDVADLAITLGKLSSAVQALLGGAADLTTKGDLQGFSTVAARIAVGTDNKVLTADSSKATGVDWKTPASPDLSSYLLASDAALTYRTRALARTGASSAQSDGGTFNCSYGQNVNLLKFAADVATFTIGINLPPAGEQVRVAVNKAIAAVTWTAGGGASFAAAPPAALARGDHLTFIYDDFNNLLWSI